MGKEKYSYELLIIDDSGKSEITTEKRLLRRYGYPPDMQLLATETVIKQAEMISVELISLRTK